VLKGKHAAQVGEELDSMPKMKDARERRRDLGIYYTPPETAKILARWVIRHPDETVLEPSFGGCAMLSAAVSVFRGLGNSNPSNQLFGFDIDAKAFEHLAQMGISNDALHFKMQDFLRSQSVDLRVDAVLANPPFVSYHRQSSEQRAFTNELREKYFSGLPKLASLWVYFILHATSYLKDRGRMAFVLPNAIGSADYAKPLLHHLSKHFKKIEMIHVAQRIFIQEGADERISLLLLEDYSAEAGKPSDVVVRNIVSLEGVDLRQGSGVGNMGFAEELRRKGVSGLAGIIDDAVIELGSVASVQIGEVVGDIKYFVRPLAEWRLLKIGGNYLFPLLTRSAQVGGLYTKNISNEGGDEVPYILVPPEKRLPKSIETYLAEYPKQARLDNRTFEKRDVWYRCSYQCDADAFIGSMSHDYPRIIENDARISCSNAFYKIKIQNQSSFSSWLSILSLTTPLRLSAELLGRVRGSGGVKLEPSDVRRLLLPRTLPALTRNELDGWKRRLDRLVRDGELESATQLADSLVYIQRGLISAKKMNELRRVRLELTNHRLNRQ
jgi:adenine-specific DNA methylase